MADLRNVQQKSVTDKGRGTDAWINFSVPLSSPLPAILPTSWMERDRVLWKTLVDPKWSNAVHIACTESAKVPINIEHAGKTTRRRLEDLFLYAGMGKGYSSFVYGLRKSHILQGNGWFVEVIRAGKGVGSRVIGLLQLPSLQCERTGDPMKPVRFTNKSGKPIDLKRHQVIFNGGGDDEITGFPSGYNDSNPARTVYPYTFWHSAILQRFGKKATGAEVQEITFIKGAMDTSFIEEAIMNAKLKAETNDKATPAPKNQNYTTILNKVIIPVMGDFPLEEKTLKLAGLPDDLTYQEFTQVLDLEYAKSLHLSPTRLNPENIGGSSLSDNGATLKEEAEEAGDGMFSVDLQQQINMWVMPALGKFSIAGINIIQKTKQAELDGIHIDNAASMVTSLDVTREEGRKYVEEKGILLPRTDTTMNVQQGSSSSDEDVTPAEMKLNGAVPA